MATSDQYDVIVVGSGASGGWAAKRLAEAGVKVAILEAGKPQRDQDFTEHVQQWELKYRNRADDLMRKTRPRQRDCYACREYNYKWFANDLEEPYTTPDDKPFSWQGRMRVVGGRTNVWGRQSYRLSEQDLNGKSFDGYGDDWPIDYKDLDTLLRHRRGLRRDLGPARRRRGAARRQVPAADGDVLRRDAAPDARQGQARLHRHDRPDGQPLASRSTAARPATTADRASRAASRTRTSTPRSRPSPTR